MVTRIYGAIRLIATLCHLTTQKPWPRFYRVANQPRRATTSPSVLSLQVLGMQTTFDTSFEPFVDRRNYAGQVGAPQRERRQFTNSHEELSPDARELAQAIDSYKLMHRRRFITYEEMLAVMKSLGYKKN